MKRKLVYRYYCEFCKKANCSASSMSKHERACTANPNRVCGMCKLTEHPQADLKDILDALETDIEATKAVSVSESEAIEFAIKIVQPKLAWTVADFCPACLLAAIRQTKKRDSVQFDWDFKAASKEFWKTHNEAVHGY